MQRLWNKQKGSAKKKKKKNQKIEKGREKRTGRNQTGTEGKIGWGEEEGGGERAILTKETGGGARRKSLPHQHILFQKSSKLC